MDNLQGIARLMIMIGLLLVALGGFFYFFGDNFSWLGHLPGDIRIEGENYSFYFPLTTMILISILINIILRIFRYLF